MINARVVKSRTRTGSALVALAALGAAALVAACGSASPAGPVTPGVSAVAIPTIAPNNPAGASTDPFQHNGVTVTGHLGDTLSFQTYGGNQVEGTLVELFDPAVSTDPHQEALPSGFHWVGVEVTFDNHSADFGTEASQLEATSSDGTVLNTDDVPNVPGAYADRLTAFEGCTQTQDGEQDVQPYTHCEAFVVPDGQKLVSVAAKVGELITFDLEKDLAVWTVP